MIIMKAVMIFGPPGAGKGTQANLLSWTQGFVHFDTGRFLEQVVHDPANQSDSVVQKERELFDTGKLNTPAWVLKIVSKKTQELAKAGMSIVFSGSPRTVFEAFSDDADQEGLISVLERAYGKDNIYPILLTVKPESSVHRNVNRKICTVCGNAILYTDQTHNHTTCPICGAPLRKRVLDNPETMKTRLKEYEERTFPIFDGLKKRGYKLIEIDGEPAPCKVHENILRQLKLNTR